MTERTSDIVGVDWSWVLLQTRAGRRRLRLDDPLADGVAAVESAGGLDAVIAALCAR